MLFSLGFVYAGGAGLMGALASVGAKLALSAESAVHDTCVNTLAGSHLIGDLDCDALTTTIRVSSGVALLVTNLLMWLMFTKSLQLCPSSVEATITNTAANFFTSGLFGWLLFEERLPPLWWCGASLIIFGVILLNKGSKSAGDKDKAD